MQSTRVIKGHHGPSMKRVEGTNEVLLGADFSNGSRPLLIVAENQDVVVVKIPGGRHLAQIGRQESHPAQYIVYAKMPDGQVMEIISIPVRTSNEVNYWKEKEGKWQLT